MAISTRQHVFLALSLLRIVSNILNPSRVCVNSSLRRLIRVCVPMQALCLAWLTSTPTSNRPGCCTYVLRLLGFRAYSCSLMGHSSFCDSDHSQHYLRGVSPEITISL